MTNQPKPELPPDTLPRGFELVAPHLTPDFVKQELTLEIQQLAEIIMTEEEPPTLVVPLDGGLFIFCAVIEKLRKLGYPAHNIPYVLAAKVGDKAYELSHTEGLSDAKRVIVTDDTAETVDSFAAVNAALAPHVTVQPELFALTRKPKDGHDIRYPGNYETALLLPDIWVWTGAGMNSNMIPTDHEDYADLVALERTAHVFLIRNNDEPNLEAYMEYLRQHNYFAKKPERHVLFFVLRMIYEREPMENDERFAYVMEWAEHLVKH